MASDFAESARRGVAQRAADIGDRRADDGDRLARRLDRQGVAIAPILTVFPGLADQVGMDAFIVVVTGGFGSLLGAFIVSIIFGLLSSYGVQFVSQFAPVLMVVFMAIVLAFRPNGLFGVKE